MCSGTLYVTRTFIMSSVTRMSPGSAIARLPGNDSVVKAGSTVEAGSVTSGVKVEAGSTDDVTDGTTVGSLVDGAREVTGVGVAEGWTVGISPVEVDD